METKIEKIVAFIPVRGGSKSIPLKNIRTLAGKPMMQWTLEAACACPLIYEVYVATDSQEIRGTVEKMKLSKVVVVGRSPETASDTASSESALIEFAEKNIFDHVVFIQATSPLLTETDLTCALNKYLESSCESLLSVVRQKRFLWQSDGTVVQPLNYNPLNRPRRQEFSGFLVENGAFYITGREQLLNTKCRISGRINCYEMPEESYFEIDEASDWIIVEELLRKRSSGVSEVMKAARNIKMVATDSDGVLTDGGMYYSENGDEMKKFNTRDGMGVSLLNENGIKTCVITGESVDLVRRRAEKIKIDEVHMGIKNKLGVLRHIADTHGIKLDEIAYIGDDMNDIEAISAVGLGCCVSDAMVSVKKAAKYITKAKGGEGAFREIVELILSSKENK